MVDNSEEHNRELLKGTDSVASQVESHSKEVTENNGEMVNHWIIYDTDKPENPKTGRAPVLAEGGTMHKSKEYIQKENQTNAKQEVASSNIAEASKEMIADVKVEESQDVKNGVAGIEVVIIGVVVILMIVLYMRFRNSG